MNRIKQLFGPSVRFRMLLVIGLSVMILAIPLLPIMGMRRAFTNDPRILTVQQEFSAWWDGIVDVVRALKSGDPA